jgi:hypothetical protein
MTQCGRVGICQLLERHTASIFRVEKNRRNTSKQSQKSKNDNVGLEVTKTPAGLCHCAELETYKDVSEKPSGEDSTLFVTLVQNK